MVLQGCEVPYVDECGGEDCGPPPADPSCAGVTGYCSGDYRVDCYADGTSVFHDCAGEPTPRTCVEGKTGNAFSAMSDEQVERCQGSPSPAFCDDGVLTRCSEGFVEVTMSCPNKACMVHEARRNFCALDTEPDPRCVVNGVQRRRRFCDGTWLVDCVDGYAARFLDCGERLCGETDGEHAFCVY